jgi:hypothetical protein
MGQLQLYKWMIGGLCMLLVGLISFSYTQLNDRVGNNVVMMGELTRSVAVLIEIQSRDSKQRESILKEIRLARESINENHDRIVLIEAGALQLGTKEEIRDILKNLELMLAGLIYRYQEAGKDLKFGKN